MKTLAIKRMLYVLVAVAGLLLTVFATNSEATAQSTDQIEHLDAGKVIYESNCAGCHGADGSGVAGRGRPLLGIGSQGERATHIASITDGKGTMPAFGEKLSGDEIEEVASYVRISFAPEAAQSGPTELAITGVGSAGLTVIGMSMLIGGWLMLVWSRSAESKARD